MATSARLVQRVAFLSLATALFVTISSAAAEPRYEHGISFFHELKYPADFTHFDYINPDAPKGGVLVQSTRRDFNTLTMFTDFLPAPATWRWMSRLPGVVPRRRDEQLLWPAGRWTERFRRQTHPLYSLASRGAVARRYADHYPGCEVYPRAHLSQHTVSRIFLVAAIR